MRPNIVFLKHLWQPLLGAGGLLAVVLWSMGVWHPKVQPGRVPAEEGLPLPSDAPLFEIARTTNAARIEAIGTVRSERIIRLSARLSAHVREVFVSAGSRVKAGQLLLTLDDRDIREQLAAAEAQGQQAESEYQRARQLYDSKATTGQALLAAETQARAARAQVERAKVMLTDTHIVSPIDGIVTERKIEAGDLAGPGQILLEVYDPLNMRLECPVPVRLIGPLTLGLNVTVELDLPARYCMGRITEIVSEIDPQSRTQLVKVHLEDGAGAVLPGSFGRLWLTDAPRPTLLAPTSAVYRVGQLEWAHVARDGRLLRQLVKTGALEGDRVEILAGLAPGDRVLVRPLREE